MRSYYAESRVDFHLRLQRFQIKSYSFRPRWLKFGHLTHAVILLVVVSALGCQKEKAKRPPGAPPGAIPGSAGAPPIPEVEVVSPYQQKILDYREFTGRTAAADRVEIRSRVSGYILQTPRSKGQPENQSANASVGQGTQGTRDAQSKPDDSSRVVTGEGDYVEKDTLLFVIDPEPYQIALDQAVANVAAGQATFKRFDLELVRARELIASRSVAQADLDLAIANQSQSSAQQQNLEAVVQRARLDLRYTRVLAPFAGIVGQTLVTRGNLVVADTTILTTLVSTDPIYVYFDVDEQSLLDYRQRIRSGSVKSARDTQIDIQLALANEADFAHAGRIDFVDNTTDPATGNTRLRGTFPNPDNSLSPGLFARVKVPFTAEYDALLVPTRALAVDQQGRYLMVVDDKQTAQRRVIETGTEVDGKTVITKGLKPEDVVIVEGLQKIRPKSPVKIRPMKTAESVSGAASDTQENPAKEQGP